MARCVLVFDVRESAVVAGAFVGEQLETVLHVPKEDDWEQWIEEFCADHLATGPCTAISSAPDPTLKKIATGLKLDLQVTDHSPTLAGLSTFHPGHNAIAIEIGAQLHFDAIVDGKVAGSIVAPGVPSDLPEPPAQLLSTLPEEQAASGHLCQVLGTIERTVRLLKKEVPDALVIATGPTTSELATDSFSVALRQELPVDKIEPELRLHGILKSAL